MQSEVSCCLQLARGYIVGTTRIYVFGSYLSLPGVCERGHAATTSVEPVAAQQKAQGTPRPKAACQLPIGLNS